MTRFLLLAADYADFAESRVRNRINLQSAIFCLLASAFCLLPSVFASHLPSSNSLKGETTFQADTAIRKYPLADRFIFVGTDSVWVSDSLLSRARYMIDCSGGTITLSASLPESARVRVTYQRLPVTGLKTSYSHRLEPSETAHREPPAANRLPPTADTGQEIGSELALNGAKTFTVSFGSSGLDLDQSLRLNLKGSIAGVGIDAALSDQGVGLDAEGTTRELSELDRVLINVRGSHLRGSLGDIDFLEPQGRLGTVARRLRGADVAWFSANDTSATSDQPGAQVGFSYARPKGRFGHNEFNGTDGRQGPYFLTGDLSGILVVAGSERVYLDGRQLVRGWDQDYAIDYDLAELTFTNRNQITALSRIEVEFEYTTDEYNRTMLAGLTGYSFGTARILAAAFTEGDDPTSHLGRAFSEAETESLALAGDTTLAWLPGADSVGPGKGDYVRNGTHYDYAGRDSGDFSVRFTRVTDSTGDYVYDNSVAAWRYVGFGNGNYVARQQVRLPERSEAYHADVNWELLPGLDLDFTGMLTRLGRNLFAAAGLRNGFGYDGSVGWRRDAGGIRYERRSLQPGFSFPAMALERDFNYTWDMTQVPAVYTRDQLTAYLKPWTPIRLDAFAGWLRTPATGQGVMTPQPPATSLDRKRARLGVGAWFADYSLERIGSLTRHNAALRPRIGSFYPAALARYEDDTLHRLLETTPELAWKPSDHVQLKLSWQRTQEQMTNDECRMTNSGEAGSPQSSIVNRQSSFLLNVYRADGALVAVRNLDIEAIAGFQDSRGQGFRESGEKTLESSIPRFLDSSHWNQLFANLVTSYSSPTGVRARVNLDQKYKQEAAKLEQFVPVTPGKGAYSRNPETGDFYPDTLGSYNKVLVNSGKTIPTRQTSLDFSGGLFSWHWFSLDLAGQLNQETGDTGTVLNNWSGLTSLDLLPYRREISATIADHVNAGFDRLFSSLPEHDFQNQASLELRTSASPSLTGKARVEIPYVRQTTEAGLLKQSETGLRGVVMPVIGSGVQLELTAAYGVRNIQMPLAYPSLGMFQVRTLTLGAERRFEFLAQTALVADVQAFRRTATVTRLPYEIQLTDPPGWSEEFTLSLNRMLGSILVLSGNYTFRKRPDRAAEHDLSVSLKAYF
jgi:hypothetical protein